MGSGLKTSANQGTPNEFDELRTSIVTLNSAVDSVRDLLALRRVSVAAWTVSSGINVMVGDFANARTKRLLPEFVAPTRIFIRPKGQ